MKLTFKQALKLSAIPLLGLMAIVSSPSSAQTTSTQNYTRLVSFGDSLSDNGNLFIATGQPPAPYNMRFTNGLVWAEYMSGTMQGFYTTSSVNSGNINYAFGGARSDTAANSNGPIPGTPIQIGAFLQKGGQFASNDVASLWIGANDLFQGMSSLPANVSQTQALGAMGQIATVTAGNVGTQVGQLASSGAKTILVMNLPNFSSLPQFNGTAAQALAGFSSSTFNTALDANLKGQAALNRGSDIIEVDIGSVFGAIIKNPTAFGLSNVTNACITVASCVTGGASVQNTYLFWDGVHPTSAGHMLIAKLAEQYLYTPTLASGVSMFSDQSYLVRQGEMGDMVALMDASSASSGKTDLRFDLINQNAVKSESLSSQAMIGGAVTSTNSHAYDYSASGARVSLVHGLNENQTLGGSLSFLGGSSQAYMLKADSISFNGDVGYKWNSGHFYTSGTLGVGFDAYNNYQRSTTIAPLNETSGAVNTTSLSGSIEAGLEHKWQDTSLTPALRLSYIRADMKAFSEEGTVAMVSYNGRHVDALSGAFEVRGSTKLGGLSLNGSVGYETVLNGKAGNLSGQLENNSAQPFSDAYAKVKGQGLMGSIGLSGRVMGADIAVSYRDNTQNTQNAVISIKKSF